MDVRVVAAGNGWQWIVDGVKLFLGSPLLWMAFTLVLFALWVASFLIPVLGHLLFYLFLPCIFTGMMLGCRAQDHGEPLRFDHLFAGFRENAAGLVTLGGVFLVSMVVISGTMFVMVGGAVFMEAARHPALDPETARALLPALLAALAVGLAAFLPVFMLLSYAPLLVAFDKLPPVQSMQLSFAACWKNAMPFLVYGLVAMALVMLVGMMTFFLGLVVLLPVLFCSVYTSYKDIFVPARPAAGGANPFLRR
jgi:uncharacterized membrane protein